MKSLFVGCLVILYAQVNFAAEVVCGSTGSKTLYPVNDLAIKLANDLDVKTCNRGEKFKAEALSQKHTLKVVKISKAQLKEIKAKLGTSTSAPSFAEFLKQ